MSVDTDREFSLGMGHDTELQIFFCRHCGHSITQCEDEDCQCKKCCFVERVDHE